MSENETVSNPGVIETPEPTNQVTLDPEKFAELQRKADEAKSAAETAEEARTEAQDLRTLMSGDPSSDQWGEAFVRRAMASGHTRESAMAQLQEARQSDNEPENKPSEPQNEDDPRYEELQQQLQQQQSQIQEAEKRRVREAFDAGIGNALQNNELLGKLGEKGEDAQQSIRGAVAQEARARLQRRLDIETRRAGKQVWDDAWLDEEIKAATDKVAENYRLVIGDVNPLGSVPETVTEIERMAKTEVPSGKWEPGMSVADVMDQNEARIKAELAQDFLSKESKI